MIINKGSSWSSFLDVKAIYGNICFTSGVSNTSIENFVGISKDYDTALLFPVMRTPERDCFTIRSGREQLKIFPLSTKAPKLLVEAIELGVTRLREIKPQNVVIYKPFKTSREIKLM